MPDVVEFGGETTPLLSGNHDSAGGGTFTTGEWATLTQDQWAQLARDPANATALSSHPVDVTDSTYLAQWKVDDPTLVSHPPTPSDALKLFNIPDFNPVEWSLDARGNWKVQLTRQSQSVKLSDYLKQHFPDMYSNIKYYGFHADFYRKLEIQANKTSSDMAASKKLFQDVLLNSDGKPGCGWARWCINNKATLAKYTLSALVTLCFLLTSLIPFINDMCHQCIYNPNASPSSPSTDCNAGDPSTWGNCLSGNLSTWLPFVLLGVAGCLFCSCCIVVLFVVMHKKKHKSFN